MSPRRSEVAAWEHVGARRHTERDADRSVVAKLTTVGEARQLQEGGIAVTHPLAHAFRGASSSAFAAYCWTRHPYMYVSFAVGPTRQLAEIATMGWQRGQQPISTPAPGPPPPGSEF
jgi:hypothetical protein